MSWKNICDKITHIQSECHGKTSMTKFLIYSQGKTFIVKLPLYNCTCAVEYQESVFTVAMYNKSHLFIVNGVSSVKGVH